MPDIGTVIQDATNRDSELVNNYKSLNEEIQSLQNIITSLKADKTTSYILPTSILENGNLSSTIISGDDDIYQDDTWFTSIDSVVDVNRVWSDNIASAYDLPMVDGKYRVSVRPDGIVGYPRDIVRAFCGSAFNELLEECASPNCYEFYYDRIYDDKYQFCSKFGDYQDDLADEQQTEQESSGIGRKYINYQEHNGIEGVGDINWYVVCNNDNNYYPNFDWYSDCEDIGRFPIVSELTSGVVCVNGDNENERVLITLLFQGASYIKSTLRNGFLTNVNASTHTFEEDVKTLYDWYKGGMTTNLPYNSVAALYASVDKVTINGKVTHYWDNTITSFVVPMTGAIKSSWRIHIPGLQSILTAQYIDYDRAENNINLGYESQLNPKLVFSQGDKEFLGKTESGNKNSQVRKEYAQLRKVLMLDCLNNNRYADNAIKIYIVGISDQYKDIAVNNMLVPEISMGKDWTISSVDIYFPAAQSIAETETASGENQIPYLRKEGTLFKKYYAALNDTMSESLVDVDANDYISYTDLNLGDRFVINLSVYLKNQVKNNTCFFEMDDMKLYFLKESVSGGVYPFRTYLNGNTQGAIKLVTPTQQIVMGISYNKSSWAMPNKITITYNNGIWGLKQTAREVTSTS